MASLRNAFLQTNKPPLYPFFCRHQPIAIAHFNSEASADEPEKRKETTSNKARPEGCKKFIAPFSLSSSRFCREVTRVMNQNINSFTKLTDSTSNDFKDCENFVHAMEISQEQDQSIQLSQIETVRSESVSLEHSTGECSGKFFYQDSESSEVEDLSLDD